STRRGSIPERSRGALAVGGVIWRLWAMAGGSASGGAPGGDAGGMRCLGDDRRKGPLGGALIDLPRDNPQRLFRRQQRGGGDTGLRGTRNDYAIGLRPCGQDGAEKLPGLAVQLVTVADIPLGGHLCLPLHRGLGHGSSQGRRWRWKRGIGGGSPVVAYSTRHLSH